jgi:hypothetical protein
MTCGGRFVKRKYSLIGIIVILIILFVSIFVHSKLNNTNGFRFITEKISAQQAMNNCELIQISDNEKDLMKLISQVNSIKDAIDKGTRKNFSIDIAKNFAKGKLPNSVEITDLWTFNTFVVIEYYLGDYRILLTIFSNGSVEKTVSNYKIKDRVVYKNTDNSLFEKGYLIPVK